jgi:succinate dehydrogenase/fumarate reductase flavoprotein subunit
MTPWSLGIDPPGITDGQCADTSRSADVVVVGAGVAGIAAARAAVEEGASVIVIEQTGDIVVRGLCFGAVNSRFQTSLGQHIDKLEIVREMQKISGNRSNMALWMKWANESGAAFDWFEDALKEVNYQVFPYYLEMWPLPPKFNNSTEYYKQFQTSIAFGTLASDGWVPAVRIQYEKSVREGAQYVFNTRAVELAQEQGRVTGVYAQGAEGGYLKISARKGVILATGDYGHNEEMVKALCPEFYEALNLGVTAIPTSNGDGHKMAVWAGGRMEPAPHAHMSHSFAGGFGGIGNTVTLHLNLNGKRFMNEDVPGQVFTNQLLRQPEHTSFQIFDSTWASRIDNQNLGHGNLDLSNTFDLAATQAALDAALTNPGPMAPLAANSLDELIALMGLPADLARKEIDRYNELCAGGVDEDFGVRPDRLFPLLKPPFYASRSFVAAGVVTAGVMVDDHLRVLKAGTLLPVSGLWAVGNVAGGRYAGDYPTQAPATSHGTAFTFGRAAGREVALL